jgi:3-oxoadipate enol-lactonase
VTDLRYEVTGSGPPVCLLHSGVTDSRAWDGQVARLAPSYTVVRYDIRGFGGSPLRPGPLSHLADLRELLDELGVEATTLVGNSFGGRIALEFALEHAARVTKLVLVAAALRDYGWSDEMRTFAQAEDEAMERGDVDAAVELNLEMWALPHVREVVRPMVRRALEVQQAAYEGDSPPEPEPPLDPPALSRLGELRVPTLVVVGDRDVAQFRDMADLFAREIPGARLEVIERAGHLPGLERPDDFDRLLLEFLENDVS